MRRTILMAAVMAASLTPIHPTPASAPRHGARPASAPLRVVTTLTTYASIARQIAGERAEVTAIADGSENPHFVQPRPSLLPMLHDADVFVVTGLDLELWVPALLDRANNRNIRPGSPGYVTARDGIALLDVPQSVSRSQGDIHIFGNPHIWTSPVNAVIIGANILAGLQRAAPADAEYFAARYGAWREEMIRRMAGDAIVDLLGAETVFDLVSRGRLLEFIEGRTYQGEPLAGKLGGWLGAARAFRGRHMVCYHKEWDYLNRFLGLTCDAYIEPKPGIPPTPKHVAEVITMMRERGTEVLLSTNYYDHGQVRSVAGRTDAVAVIVPSNTEGAPGIDSYVELVDLWVGELARAFTAS